MPGRAAASFQTIAQKLSYVAQLNEPIHTVPFQEATLNHEVAMQNRKIILPHQDRAE